jgi:SAM-dependent methyltransferase
LFMLDPSLRWDDKHSVRTKTMQPQVLAIRQFYSSPLGRKVKQRLASLARHHWQDGKGEPIVGIGYATPVLRALERAGEKPSLTVALMPAEQGAIYWPVHADNKSVLADPLRPPFSQNSLSRIVVMHGLEYLPKPEELLSILWELLTPGGKVFLVVPNRRSLWARAGATPFASGTPYRMVELRQLLIDARFTLRHTGTALYTPPSAHPFWLAGWLVLERLGSWLLPGLGGALIIEAEKQIYAGVGERVGVTKRTHWATQGVPVASPKLNRF